MTSDAIERVAAVAMLGGGSPQGSAMSIVGDIERALGNLYEYRFIVGAVNVAVAAAIVYIVYRRRWYLVLLNHPVASAVIGVPAVIVGVTIGWWMASPLFTNVTVEEEFPFAYSAAVPEGMERVDVEQVMAGMAMVDDPAIAESMPGASVIDAGAMMGAGESIMAMKTDDIAALTEALTVVLEGATTEEMQQVAIVVESVMRAQVDPQDEVRPVKQGQFRDADSFHRGSGDASIFATPGGNHLLRLEDLNVTNGPALHVLLSSHPDPVDSDEVKQEGYIDLGALKGNRGNQNYQIPADVDVAGVKSVIIYCKPFSVVFSVAPLAAS